jgi:hypothetical protein
MQREDITRFWGRDNLRRWSKNRLRDVAIPESSKSFFSDVGLPFRVDWTIRFDDKEAGELPRLLDRPNYRRIGFDVDVPICLDEGRRGCVLEVGQEFGYPERYFNSSVELFAAGLTCYQQYRLVAENVDLDRSNLVAATERKIRHTDPEAFGHEEYCWPLIIEQMSLGRL